MRIMASPPVGIVFAEHAYPGAGVEMFLCHSGIDRTTREQLGRWKKRQNQIGPDTIILNNGKKCSCCCALDQQHVSLKEQKG